MKNPNGYGSISKLSGNRRKPYIVRKTSGQDENGKLITSIIGYYETRKKAMLALAEYNKDPYDIDAKKVTVKEIYDLWGNLKFPKINKKSQQNYECAFKHCADLYDTPMADIRPHHIEKIIKGMRNKYSAATMKKIKSLFNQLFAYSLKNEIIDKDYSGLVDLDNLPEPEKKVPFSDKEIQILFDSSLPYVDVILILIFTGFRISELLDVKSADVNLDEWYIVGGAKTEAGKNRLVPINKKIQPFIKKRLEQNNEYLISTPEGEKMTYHNFRKYYFLKTMDTLDMNHTIHETRHTFATLLNNADANKTSITKLIGHSNFSTTEKIYTHKDIAELKKAVDLI